MGKVVGAKNACFVVFCLMYVLIIGHNSDVVNGSAFFSKVKEKHLPRMGKRTTTLISDLDSLGSFMRHSYQPRHHPRRLGNQEEQQRPSPLASSFDLPSQRSNLLSLLLTPSAQFQMGDYDSANARLNAIGRQKPAFVQPLSDRQLYHSIFEEQ